MGKLEQMVARLRSAGHWVDEDDIALEESAVQWSTMDGSVFSAAGTTQPELPSGVYEIHTSPQGTFFSAMNVDVSNMLKFPDSNSEDVIDEIESFWEKEDRFLRHGLQFKRGILLYGPPGTGKSCTIKQIIENLVTEHSGVVFNFTDPHSFVVGYEQFRSIEPHTKVVCIMEDLESLLARYDQSVILNILDGVTVLDKIVFIATTNYPERLEARISNRPSRFDRRIEIGFPSARDRYVYLEHVFKPCGVSDKKLKKMVKDTNGFSIAHLKELFIGVHILENKYEDALANLKAMIEVNLSSE